MKNYLDKYIKYKLKYIKIKNQQYGGETYDCSDRKITEEICEKNTKGQWDNLEECEKSNICIENNRIINKKELLVYNLYKVIMLIRKHKKLLEKYKLYDSKKEEIPTLSILINNLKSISLIENNKNLFEKYNIYKDGDKLVYSYEELKNKIKEINSIEVIKSIKSNPESILLIEQNPFLKQYVGYRNNDIVKSVDKVKQDIDNIKRFLRMSYRDTIAKTFYISGLLTFAVYKSKELNKIIYLFGEQHSYSNACDHFAKTDNLIYNADKFFLLLLNSFIKGKNNNDYKNKLDVFIEMKYDPIDHLNNKFENIVDFNHYPPSFMVNIWNAIYDNGCYPAQNLISKNNNKEKKLCMYDPYVRFHHSDLRKISDDFVRYIEIIWLMLEELIYSSPNYELDYFNGTAPRYINFINYSNYSNHYYVHSQTLMTELYYSSEFINKINKQIDNITSYINLKMYCRELVKELENKCINLINSGNMNYQNILNILDNRIEKEEQQKLYHIYEDIFHSIMDLYLLSRILRSFDKGTYNSSNIIIYAGNYHIKQYIKLLKELSFEEKYYVNNLDPERIACVKVDEFDIEFF